MRYPRALFKRYSILLCGLAASFLTGQSPLEETVDYLDQWVQTEQLISETEAEWEMDKASMENLMAIYEREIESLEDIITAAEKDTSAAEERRANLMEQSAAVREMEARLSEMLAEAEAAVKRLETVLPTPLREELQPLFNSIPDDADATKLALGQRVQPVVAILTQVQKFNQVVTVEEGFREFEEGRTLQTEKVYFGLGAAFYVDQANEHAGRGVLGPEGWVWEDDNSLIETVRELITIYRGGQQAKYISLPVDAN